GARAGSGARHRAGPREGGVRQAGGRIQGRAHRGGLPAGDRPLSARESTAEMRAFFQASDLHVIASNRTRWGTAFSFGSLLIIGVIFALPATATRTGVPGRDVFLL